MPHISLSGISKFELVIITGGASPFGDGVRFCKATYGSISIGPGLYVLVIRFPDRAQLYSAVNSPYFP